MLWTRGLPYKEVQAGCDQCQKYCSNVIQRPATRQLEPMGRNSEKTDLSVYWIADLADLFKVGTYVCRGIHRSAVPGSFYVRDNDKEPALSAAQDDRWAHSRWCHIYDEKVPDRFRESMKKNRHFTILIYIRSQSRPYHGEAKELRLSVFKVFCMSNVSEFVSSHIKTTGHSDVFVWNGVWVFAQLLSYPRVAMSILYMGIFQKSHDFDRLFD